MSLDYRVTNVRNHVVVTTEVKPNGEHHWHPVTTALVWATMAIDMGEITERNWKEFHTRVSLWETNIGTFLVGRDNSPRFISATEVYAHIGLVTNVTNQSQSKFMAKLWDRVREKLANEQVNGERIYKAYEVDKITKTPWRKLWEGNLGVSLEDRLIASNPSLDPTVKA